MFYFMKTRPLVLLDGLASELAYLMRIVFDST